MPGTQLSSSPQQQHQAGLPTSRAEKNNSLRRPRLSRDHLIQDPFSEKREVIVTLLLQQGSTVQKDKMLAQILEQMWVDPEVLEALSEDQKRILFLKMREEQVRRWRVREEEEEREGRSHRNIRPKKASSKQVSWLLSRDGEVSVVVIGEVDEFRSSKVLQNHMNNRLTHGTKCNQTVDLLPGSDAQQHSIKGDAKLPLTDVNEDPSSPNNQISEEEDCSTDEDPKDPEEDSYSESGGSSEDVSEQNLAYRPHLQSNSKVQPKNKQSDTQKDNQQEKETLWGRETSENGGRVAQLRKAFADKPCSKPSCNKPPLPVKPAHLQKRSTALVH